jgi:hypothetical protein
LSSGSDRKSESESEAWMAAVTDEPGIKSAREWSCSLMALIFCQRS